ncbi:NgoMIV family type II restriction endonuclease [Georgenia daeguensis]|uniref:NgoMIV family type II restriction endonuclease n=1 Tax=Georgenia daeguensis TaxID=908355 RepID=A0ABP6UN45_9MICO
MTALLSAARRAFHQRLVADSTLSLSTDGVASNADSNQKTSMSIALRMAHELGALEVARKLDGQRAGKLFEQAVQEFLGSTFPRLGTIRPGNWRIENVGGSRAEYQIARYEPYTHLDDLASAIRHNPMLASVLGNSYEISPDVLILREPEPDDVINRNGPIVDDDTAGLAVIRKANQERAIVHAIVSCKWTLRSDRAQNARSEALNMIRNRKGRTPHIVVVTAEPTPSRLASLALGTGDLDTVYHFALPELTRAVLASDNDEAVSMLNILISGKRLRDISDLPLDLAV